MGVARSSDPGLHMRRKSCRPATSVGISLTTTLRTIEPLSTDGPLLVGASTPNTTLVSDSTLAVVGPIVPSNLFFVMFWRSLKERRREPPPRFILGPVYLGRIPRLPKKGIVKNKRCYLI